MSFKAILVSPELVRTPIWDPKLVQHRVQLSIIFPNISLLLRVLMEFQKGHRQERAQTMRRRGSLGPWGRGSEVHSKGGGRSPGDGVDRGALQGGEATESIQGEPLSKVHF